MALTIIGNITCPANTGSFARLTTNTEIGNGTLYLTGGANFVMRIGGVTPEVTMFPNGGIVQFAIPSVDPSTIYVRSGSGTATVVYAYFVS
jgi:hypothetical protein